MLRETFTDSLVVSGIEGCGIVEIYINTGLRYYLHIGVVIRQNNEKQNIKKCTLAIILYTYYIDQ